jgi:hypothetical protein
LESQIAWPKSKVIENVTNKNKTPETSPVSSPTNKTDRHDIAEMLLKVALNTIPITYHTLKSNICFVYGVHTYKSFLKTKISNVVRSTCLWRNLHQVRSKLTDWKAKLPGQKVKLLKMSPIKTKHQKHQCGLLERIKPTKDNVNEHLSGGE